MRIEVKVPQLPESVAEATLVNWHKKPGEAIKRDENLIDIETDKVVLELPAPADGAMAEIVKPDGSTVTSGEVIAVIDTDAAAKEVVWCQEEPQNQGAWYRLRAMLRADIDAKKVLAYAGRPVSASPAVGYAAKHMAEQKKLIEDAFAEKLQSGEMVLAR